ncbi:ZIP family metal transporter [Metabacillus idriensis]|uniref:ZIP family metal transporter n=1 Tax=Metabacillus idriensis TaxID=324768 RepID=UPI00174E32DB|nr:ZIP family metal transporter [Metabacillus idriensis]
MSYDAMVSLFVFLFIISGSMIGGMILKVTSGLLRKNAIYLNLFCGGLLGGLLIFDLIPETLGNYNAIGISAGFFLGILIMIIADHFLHHNDIPVHSKVGNETFFFISLALIIHSIPTGIALGLSFDNGNSSSLLLAVLIHQVPEGAALMAAALSSQLSFNIFLFISLLIAGIFAANTFLGLTFQIKSIKIDTLVLGTAVGTLAYVSFYEILFKELKKFSLHTIFVTLLGFFAIKLYFLFI